MPKVATLKRGSRARPLRPGLPLAPAFRRRGPPSPAAAATATAFSGAGGTPQSLWTNLLVVPLPHGPDSNGEASGDSSAAESRPPPITSFHGLLRFLSVSIVFLCFLRLAFSRLLACRDAQLRQNIRESEREKGGIPVFLPGQLHHRQRGANFF